MGVGFRTRHSPPADVRSRFRIVRRVWTHDQRHLVHMLDGSIFWQAPDGETDVPELLAERHSVAAPCTFSKDDHFLVFREDSPVTGHDLMMLSLADRRVQPLLQTSANELNAEISRDGRWLAYESDESGPREVYVRPFPDVNAGRWQVSTAGGRTHALVAPTGGSCTFRPRQRDDGGARGGGDGIRQQRTGAAVRAP